VRIIADDFTSAMDSTCAFAARGHPGTMLLEQPSPGDGGQAPIVAVDLDTRAGAQAEAAQGCAAAAAVFAEARILLKTVDSTLRGHVAEEVVAAVRGSGRALAIIAPAFPAAGRATVHGVQLVNGEPVSSAFANDRRHPPVTARLADLVAGPVTLWRPTERSRALPASGYLLCDAAHDGDLDHLVARVGPRADVLWVGSPGLAAALARACRRRRAGRVPRARHVLIVIGSCNPVTVEQLRAAAGYLRDARLGERIASPKLTGTCKFGVAAGT
jgi:D-threonate/D-erythronate kinase